MANNRNRRRRQKWRSSFRRCTRCDDKGVIDPLVWPEVDPEIRNASGSPPCHRLPEVQDGNTSIRTQGSSWEDVRGNLIQVCNCLRGANYVHTTCQREYMLRTGRIVCEECRAPFRGLEFQFTKKSFLEYIANDPKGNTAFTSCLMLMMSLFITLSSVMDSYLNHYDDLVGELTNFTIPYNFERAKQNAKFVSAWNMRVIVPCFGIYALVRNGQLFMNDYRDHIKNYFNVRFP